MSYDSHHCDISVASCCFCVKNQLHCEQEYDPQAVSIKEETWTYIRTPLCQDIHCDAGMRTGGGGAARAFTKHDVFSLSDKPAQCAHFFILIPTNT